MFITWRHPHSHSICRLSHMPGTTAPSSRTSLCRCSWHLSLEPSFSCRQKHYPLTPHSSHFCPASSSYCPIVCLCNIDCPITQTGGLAQRLAFVTVIVYRLPRAQNSSALWRVLRFPFWLHFFFFFCIWWCWRLNSGHSPCEVSPLLLSHIPRQDSLPFKSWIIFLVCVHQQAFGWCSYFSRYERFWNEYGSIDVSFRTYSQLFWVHA